jgi:tripartite-type tricarboxylate transporter receptor subunit TctC
MNKSVKASARARRSLGVETFILHPSSFILAAMIALSAAAAHAQTYPVKPIRLIVSVQPGGNLDLMGRSIADYASAGLGQRMYVENRPGGNSTIGLSAMARAAPDGYTFAMLAQSGLIAAMMMKNAPYDPLRDFAGVSLIALLPQLLVVHKSLPVTSIKALIALAKSRPGELNSGTSGNGSGSHLSLELFNKMAGVQITRIPYNGDGPAIVDLIGGQVPVKFDNVSTSLQHVRAGQLRALGITSRTRSPLLPDVAPISDTLPGYQMTVMNGVIAPAGTPPEVLARVHAEIVKFTTNPDVRGRFTGQGVELASSANPAEFTAYIKADYAKWAKVLEDAGIKPE